MSNINEIRVPDIGDFSVVPIVEIPVSAGDVVEDGDTLIVLESDKATLDVPAPMGGRIIEVKVAENQMVSEGSVILTMEADATSARTSEEEAAAPPLPVSEPTPTADAKPTPAPIRTEPGQPIHASPSIRRFARQLGVVIVDVTGTGPKGRITREDVETFVKARLRADSNQAGATAPASIAGLPAWPEVDHAKFGPIERVELSRINKISGPALARNAMVIPHVTNFEKADVTDLEAFRKAMNAEAGPDEAKITMLAFAVKAVVSALKTFEKFNSSLDGDALIVKQYWNIGVAADTPDGLVVPVIKEADRKGLHAIAAEMAELAASARASKLKASDMQGATFTISSLGGIGGTNFTPIINAPEVAILGMPRAEMQPVCDGAAFQPRLIQP
ncbi:MAG: 2-oxo acid dehydrogenase subunit E2, partial [Geminicoccaceae bacterium]